MLLGDGVVLVEPGAPPVAHFVSFEDVGSAIVYSDMHADDVVAEEDLAPAATVAPFFLSALYDPNTITVTVSLDFHFAGEDQGPHIESAELESVLLNQSRSLYPFLDSKQVWRVVLRDRVKDVVLIVRQALQLLMDGHDGMLLHHHVVGFLQQALMDGLLRHLSEVLVLYYATFDRVECHPRELSAVSLHDVDGRVLTFFQADLDVARSARLSPPAPPSLLSFSVRDGLAFPLGVLTLLQLEAKGILGRQRLDIEHSELAEVDPNQVVLCYGILVFEEITTL